MNLLLLFLLIGQSNIEVTRKNAIVRAAERVGPAVVSISVISTEVVAGSPLFEDPFFGQFWREFFPPRYFKHKVRSLGSGVIIDRDGHILTNEHVVHDAEQIKVTLPDGRTFDGELVGSDPRLDIALLKIDGNDLPYAPLGNSDSLYIGEWAIAIGNPFGYLLEDLEPTVTAGVISALHRTFKGGGEREYRDMIQTDAAINPGNSGGPLVNALGEVIGINTFIITKSGGSEGIGFAIPINTVKKVIPELKKYGRVRDAYLGISVQNLNQDIREGLDYPHLYGVIVLSVDSKGPSRSKIKEGDIVELVNGRKIYNEGDWADVTYALVPGEMLTMRVFRDGKEFDVKIRVREFKISEAELPWGMRGATVNEALVQKYRLSVTKGVLVLEVEPTGRAARLGIQKGDVILEVNGKRINDVEDLKKALKKKRRGWRIVVDRYGSTLVLSSFFGF
jgi:serine protease Do